MFCFLWIVITIILLYLYHSKFKVVYFNLGKGLLGEIISSGLIGYCITLALLYVIQRYWIILLPTVIIILLIINKLNYNKKA